MDYRDYSVKCDIYIDEDDSFVEDVSMGGLMVAFFVVWGVIGLVYLVGLVL